MAFVQHTLIIEVSNTRNDEKKYRCLSHKNHYSSNMNNSFYENAIVNFYFTELFFLTSTYQDNA